MAVGTVLGASYWSAWSAREAVIEQEKLLKVLISMPWYLLQYSIHFKWFTDNELIVKDGHEGLLNVEAGGSTGMVDINVASAIMFVVVASCFLIMLYKLMSYWFVELLVVIFCIGGVEVQFYLTDPTLFSSWLLHQLLLCLLLCCSSFLKHHCSCRVCKHAWWLCYQGRVDLLGFVWIQDSV